MNKVILLGRLTKDPAVCCESSDECTAVTRFVIAVNHYNPKTQQNTADFIHCVAFGKTAENIATYTQKGRMISVEGHLQSGMYEENGQKHYMMEVVTDQIYFGGSKKETSMAAE